MSDERLWHEIGSFLAAEGVELDDLEVVGRGRVVRVTVDAEGGLDVDRIAELSRGVSRLLDDDDRFGGPFTLEVTSPGLERQLRRPSHYGKSVGREVVVTTRVPVAGATSHRGLLEEVGEEAVSVRVADEVVVLPFDVIKAARTVFRWERSPKPGRK